MPSRASAGRPLERGADLRLRRRADARHLAQPSRRRGLAQLLGVADAERAAELDHALRRQPDEPAEADQLRPHLALQLVELRDPPRLDELAQPRLDRRPDPAQLPDAPGPDELGDRRRRRPDQLGRPPVRAHAVEARAGEIEQRREALESLGDRCIAECRVVG